MNDVIFMSNDSLIEIFNFWSAMFLIFGMWVLKSSLAAILILSSFSNQQSLITVLFERQNRFYFQGSWNGVFLEYISEISVKKWLHSYFHYVMLHHFQLNCIYLQFWVYLKILDPQFFEHFYISAAKVLCFALCKRLRQTVCCFS